MKTQFVRALAIFGLLGLFSLSSMAADNWFFKDVDRVGGPRDRLQTWNCVYKKSGAGRGANMNMLSYLPVQFVTEYPWWNGYETALAVCINTYGRTQSNLA